MPGGTGMIIDYLTPSTLDEAMAALVKQPDRSAVIAGGTEGFANLQKSKKGKILKIKIK